MINCAMNNIELNVVSDNQVSPIGTLKRRILYDRKRNYITSKPNVLHELLQRFPNKDWAYYELAENPNMNLNMLPRDKYFENRIFWSAVTANPNITTLNFVEETIDTIPWDFQLLGRNPNITVEFILKHKDRRVFGYHWACKQPNITPGDIIKIVGETNFSDFVRYLSYNPNLTEELVTKHEKEYDFYMPALISNSNLSLDFLSTRCDLKSRASILSSRPDITLDFVLAHKNWPWDWDRLSANANIDPKECYKYCGIFHIDGQWASNPNLTFDFIIEHIENVNMAWLSSNKFLWDDHVYRREINNDITARRARLCNYSNIDPRGFGGIIARYIDWA